MLLKVSSRQVSIGTRNQTTLEALLLGQVLVAGYRLADPFQHSTPVHCRAEIHSLPTRKSLVRTAEEREVVRRGLANREVSL